MTAPRLTHADLRAAAAGEPVAIDRMIVDFGPTILRWCARLGGPRISAEDAAQDVLERVLRKLGGLSDPATFPAWVFATCRGVIAQHRRRAWLRGWIGEPDPATPDPSHDPERGQLVHDVHLVLEALPVEAREVLVLCDLEERTASETALILGVPEGTVRSRLRLARTRFAELAERRGLAAPGEAVARSGSVLLGLFGGDDAWARAGGLEVGAAVDRLRRHFCPPSVGPMLAALSSPDPGAWVSRARSRAQRTAPRASRWWAAVGLFLVAAVGSVGRSERVLLGDAALHEERGAQPDPAGRPMYVAPAAITLREAPPETTTVLPPVSRVSRADPARRGQARVDAAPVQELPAVLAHVASPRAPEVPPPSLRLSPLAPTSWSAGRAELFWSVGSLIISLQAVDQAMLTVSTREGRLVFSDADLEVHRDRLGTRVQVRRGHAELECGVERVFSVSAGFDGWCLPTRAEGWLGRAEELTARAASPAEVLQAVRAGLQLTQTSTAVGAELLALQVDLLMETGELGAAVEAASRYPAEGPRAAVVRRVAQAPPAATTASPDLIETPTTDL